MVSTQIIYLRKGCSKLGYKAVGRPLKNEERQENLLLKQMK